MDTLIIVVIAFVAVIGFILFPVMHWKWSFSDGPLFAVSLIMALLYIFGLFNLFPFAAYFILALSILLSILAFYLNRKDLMQAVNELLSPSSLIFWLMFALLGYLSRSWLLQEWDEFSHWGIFAKGLYYRDVFPSLVDFNVVWRHYPPIISLFQYYLTKLGGYSEQGVYFAQNIIILAAIIAILKNIPWKKWFLAAGTVLFCYLAIYFWGYRLNSIYVDGLLGIIFGSTLMAYFGENKREWSAVIKIAPTLFILPLIKQIAIFFSMVIAGFIIFDQLFLKDEQDFEVKSILSRKFGISFLAYSPVIWIPMISYYSWQGFLKYWHINIPSPTSSFSITNVLDSFSVLATDYQRATINSFLTYFQEMKIGNSTLGSTGVIVAFILLILVYTLIKFEKIQLRRSIWLHAILLGSFILYSFTLMLLYAFSGDQWSGSQLQSYTRYMGTYLLGWSFCLFGLFYLELKENLFNGLFNQKIFLAVWAGLILISFKYTPPIILFSPPQDTTINIRTSVKRFIPLMEENSRIYLIYQETEGFIFHITRYFIAPRTTNKGCWSLGKPFYEGDIWTCEILPDVWAKSIRQEGYNYILVGAENEAFWDTYGALFTGEDTDTPQLFKVVSNTFLKVEP